MWPPRVRLVALSTATTQSSCLKGSSYSPSPVESNQTQAVLSVDPAAISVASGETSTARTQLRCPLNPSLFWVALHILHRHLATIRPAHDPLHFLLRNTAISITGPAVIGVPTSLPSSTRQLPERRILPSLPPLTICLSSTRSAAYYMTSRASISIGFASFWRTLLVEGRFPFNSSVPASPVQVLAVP